MTDEYPSWALQPRKETGAAQFTAKNPTYDGRGVVIAVFDSGEKDFFSLICRISLLWRKVYLNKKWTS